MFKSVVIKMVLVVMLLPLVGCKENVGNWPPEKVAPIVGQSLELSDFTLSKVGDTLEGTGKRTDGETVTVKVTQDPTNNKFTWDAKGDRGLVEMGNYTMQ